METNLKYSKPTKEQWVLIHAFENGNNSIKFFDTKEQAVIYSNAQVNMFGQYTKRDVYICHLEEISYYIRGNKKRA